MIEHYPWTAVYFAIVYMIVGLSLLNLILGVVVDTAARAREHLEEQLRDESLMNTLDAHSNLRALCLKLDSNKNGKISHKELFEGYEESEEFREALTAMGVSQEDLKVLWLVLEENLDEEGHVSYDKFVTCCYKLKSSTTNFMLAYIKYYIHDIKYADWEEHTKKDKDDVRNPTAITHSQAEHAEQKRNECVREVEKECGKDMNMHHKVKQDVNNLALDDFEHQWNRLYDAITQSCKIQQETFDLHHKAYETCEETHVLVRGVAKLVGQEMLKHNIPQ
jgi:hypothetical protein